MAHFAVVCSPPPSLAHSFVVKFSMRNKLLSCSDRRPASRRSSTPETVFTFLNYGNHHPKPRSPFSESRVISATFIMLPEATAKLVGVASGTFLISSPLATLPGFKRKQCCGNRHKNDLVFIFLHNCLKTSIQNIDSKPF